MKTEYEKSVDQWVSGLDSETIAKYLLMPEETFTDYEWQALLLANHDL